MSKTKKILKVLLKLLILLAIVGVIALSVYYFYLKSKEEEYAKDFQVLTEMEITSEKYDQIEIGQTREEIDEALEMKGIYSQHDFPYNIYIYNLYDDEGIITDYQLRLYFNQSDELVRGTIFRKI